MLVVMPDARHAGPAEIEQNVFGQRAEIRAYQAGSQADIPPEVWTGADALMIWGRLHFHAASDRHDRFGTGSPDDALESCRED